MKYARIICSVFPSENSHLSTLFQVKNHYTHSGERLFPVTGDTPAKVIVTKTFRALASAPRKGNGMVWSQCKVNGTFLQDLLQQFGLTLNDVTPHSTPQEYDDRSRGAYLYAVAHFMYKAVIKLSEKCSVTGMPVSSVYDKLKDHELDHTIEKEFEVSALCKHLTKLLLQNEAGLEKLLAELRGTDCKWRGAHEHGTTRGYPINPHSKNLLSYIPLGLSPREVIDTHIPFRKMVKALFVGRADRGWMSYEHMAFNLFSCLGFWIGDVCDASKDEVNVLYGTKSEVRRIHCIVGQIIDKTLKRLSLDTETANWPSFNLQGADFDHQGDKRIGPAEARSHSIPNQLRELAKCLPTRHGLHDHSTKYNHQAELDLSWLFENSNRSEREGCEL